MKAEVESLREEMRVSNVRERTAAIEKRAADLIKEEKSHARNRQEEVEALRRKLYAKQNLEIRNLKRAYAEERALNVRRGDRTPLTESIH